MNLKRKERMGKRFRYQERTNHSLNLGKGGKKGTLLDARHKGRCRTGKKRVKGQGLPGEGGYLNQGRLFEHPQQPERGHLIGVKESKSRQNLGGEPLLKDSL